MRQTCVCSLVCVNAEDELSCVLRAQCRKVQNSKGNFKLTNNLSSGIYIYSIL